MPAPVLVIDSDLTDLLHLVATGYELSIQRSLLDTGHKPLALRCVHIRPSDLLTLTIHPL